MRSKNDVKATRVISIVRCEEAARLRIPEIRVNVGRVEVICDVVAGERQPHTVVRRDFEFLRDLQIERQKGWKPRRVGISDADKTLGLVRYRIGKAAPHLEHRGNGDPADDWNGSPRNQTMRRAEWKVGKLILPQDWIAEVAEVSVEIIQISARSGFHVRDTQRSLPGEQQLRRQLQSAIGGGAVRTEKDRLLAQIIDLGSDDVNVFCPARYQVYTEAKPSRDHL